MRNSTETRFVLPLRLQPTPALRHIEPGQALHLGRLGGELTVLEGRLWLTRNGDLGDHVVEPGQRVRLALTLMMRGSAPDHERLPH